MTENDESKEFLAMLDESLPESTEAMLKAKEGLPIVKVDVPRSAKLMPRSSVAESAFTKRWHENQRQKKARRKRAKQSRRRNRK